MYSCITALKWGEKTALQNIMVAPLQNCCKNLKYGFFSESITNGNTGERETNSNLLKISKQIQQVWLWEDRKGKDVHPDRNVDK
jgi:hypothetical protein